MELTKRGLLLIVFVLFQISFLFATVPSNLIVNPNYKSASPNEEVNFETTIINDDGWENIYQVYFLIKDSIGSNEGFWGRYKVDNNNLYIKNDEGDWVDGCSPGSVDTLENSYVSLSCYKTIVSGNGLTLKVYWNLKFKDRLNGKALNLYIYAVDINDNSRWEKNLGKLILNSTSLEPPSSCIPSCSGRECGDSGCGGYCGVCSEGKECNSQGQCVQVENNCTDSDKDGYYLNGGSCGVIDCNDQESSINTGKNELCNNNIDDNCNGYIDEECKSDGGGDTIYKCSGCLLGDSCYSIGIRFFKDNEQSYCDVDKTIKLQKNLDISCENNFECSSNECSGRKCVLLKEEVQKLKSDIKKLEEEIKIVKSEVGFFKKLLCNIMDFLGIEGYNECVGQPPASVCGNNQCEIEESCFSCSQDCGECVNNTITCGDNKCSPGESCSICSQDCGSCIPICGDGSCNGEETCSTCQLDCGKCTPTCGDEICNGAETCSTCSGDCGSCVPTPNCGNNKCESGESCLTCSQDCGVCPSESCGDGLCNIDESCSLCSQDCGVCDPLKPV